MKAGFAVAALAAACLSTVAAAQMGPGMMGGAGPGMMGGGGPGMMGGAGPGMRSGQPGCPMHQGAMGGSGPAQGRMAARMAALDALDLTDEQRGKVTAIRRDLQRKMHALKGSARELRWQGEDAAKSAEFDEAAARKRFDAAAALRKQMFEARLEARKGIHAVLTQEQREQLRRSLARVPPGPPAHH
jgi:Spy/CpxP family protein refolding chaperone